MHYLIVVSYLRQKKRYPDFTRLTEYMYRRQIEEFKEAMNCEIKSLENIGTWRVMLRKIIPKGVNVIPSNWAFKVKMHPDGRFRNFKYRFCVRGYFQQDGVDYTKPYSPVVSWSTVRNL